MCDVCTCMRACVQVHVHASFTGHSQLHIEGDTKNVVFLHLKVHPNGGLVVPLEHVPTIPATPNTFHGGDDGAKAPLSSYAALPS